MERMSGSEKGAVTMPLRSYLLAILLMTLIGLSVVHEVVGQIRLRYRIARTLAQEKELKCRLAELRTRWAELTSPLRLSRLQAEKKLLFVPLATVEDLRRQRSLTDRVAEVSGARRGCYAQ